MRLERRRDRRFGGAGESRVSRDESRLYDRRLFGQRLFGLAVSTSGMGCVCVRARLWSFVHVPNTLSSRPAKPEKCL